MTGRSDHHRHRCSLPSSEGFSSAPPLSIITLTCSEMTAAGATRLDEYGLNKMCAVLIDETRVELLDTTAYGLVVMIARTLP